MVFNPVQLDGRSAVPIRLKSRERKELLRIVRAQKSQQRMVLRARIVLLAADGRNNCEIADELRCDVQTARKWRFRFAEWRLEGLEDLPRSGRPVRFEAGQRHDIFSTLLGSPPPPYARWSLDLLAQELVARGIVRAISKQTISRWLRTADIKPHRCRYWLNSKDPDFKTKMKRVVDLYINKPRSGRVICVDEKTCIQAREQLHPEKPMKEGLVRRPEYEYKRHGTVHLIAAFEVHTGKVTAQCVDKNDSRAFIAFLKALRKKYPRETLYLILDNGTTHRSEATTKFLARHPRLVLVFLPIHASWLNQIEIWFSVLSRRAIRHVSFRSRQELIDRIHAYVAAHNRHAKPYRWSTKGVPLKA